MSRSTLLRMRHFQATLVEKIKIHILCSVFFFRKFCLLWGTEKYCGAGHVTYYSMTHAHYVLDTRSYTHTHTHSEYWILIAVPLKQLFYERASVLHYTFNVLYAHHMPVHQASLRTVLTILTPSFNHCPFLTYSDTTYIILTEIIIIFNCYRVAATRLRTFVPLYSPWRWPQ